MTLTVLVSLIAIVILMAALSITWDVSRKQTCWSLQHQATTSGKPEITLFVKSAEACS